MISGLIVFYLPCTLGVTNVQTKLANVSVSLHVVAVNEYLLSAREVTQWKKHRKIKADKKKKHIILYLNRVK